MKPLIRLVALMLLLSLPQHSVLADSSNRISSIDPPHRVLLVGNSFTFYNNGLHTHLRKLLQSSNEAKSTAFAQKATTISGARLADHKPGLSSLLKSFKPDAVILQGHSVEPIAPDQTASFRDSVKQLARMVRKHHATPILLMTWAYTAEPEMTKQLAKAYGSIGHELGIMVLPVGLAFQLAEQQIPGVQLRIEDRKHPTLEGSYLGAAVIYAALYRRSPVELPYTAGLEPGLARQLREVAAQSVETYYR